MADQKTIQINFKAISDFKGVLDGVKQIQNVINQLKLTPTLEANFKKVFSDVENYGQKAAAALQSGFKTKGDVSTYAKNLNAVTSALQQIQSNINKIDGKILEESFKNNIDTTKLKELNDETLKLRTELAQMRADNLNKITAALKDIEGISKAGSWEKFKMAFEAGDIEGMQKALNALNTGYDRYSSNVKNAETDTKQYKSSLDILQGVFDGIIKASGEYAEKARRLTEIDLEKGALSADAVERGTQAVREAGVATGQLADKNKELADSEIGAAQGTQQLNSELDQVKSRIQYFFGLNNAVLLFQRAVRSAFNTIKDLDKVMTETAVVTRFDVGDMWAQLPEYTKRANELGISIHDAYEAATLYYQQGLETNEVMAVSNETLKMARIAGLDAAEATDRMTNALRGFNMAIDETSAKNINDVYSNLAAKTASNVDEISTAMTKVASLANNANMSFENTAAFLSQIIETTRESAETAGTALKTVIARFSEVKSLYSEGELLGDFEGEEIDVNKVSKALRTAGINLNEYLTGMKGLDQIFMELSEKWDSLDQVQQRYIATMAAGSRQQSRFIALMQDNARMTELVREANNAAGASEEQFGKTLDSLQSKLAQLKNAWDTFLMGLANNEVVKFVVDLLTQIITKINDFTTSVSKLTGTLGGLVKSIISVGTVVASLSLGKGILNKITGDLGRSFRGEGRKAGMAFITGLSEETGKANKIFSLKYWRSIFTVPPQAVDTKAITQLTTAMQANVAANEGVTNAIAAQDAVLARHQIVAMDVATMEEEQAAANAKVVAAKEASILATEQENAALAQLGITKEMAIALDKLGLADDEKALVLQMAMKDETFARALAEGKLTAEEVKQTIAQEVANKARSKGLIGIIAATIAEAKNGVALKSSTIGQLLYAAAANGSTAAQWLLNTAIYSCPLGWFLAIIGAIIAAIAALTVGIVLLVKNIKNSTPEAKLKAAQEATERAAAAADQATEAYNNLNDSLNNLGDKYDDLATLTKGTLEWKQAISDVNKEILALIEKFPELAEKGLVSIGEGGILKIDFSSPEVRDILGSYFEQSVQASAAAVGAKIKEKELEREEKINEAATQGLYKKVTTQEITKTDTGRGAVTNISETVTSELAKDLSEKIALAFASGEIYSEESYNEWIRKYKGKSTSQGNYGQGRSWTRTEEYIFPEFEKVRNSFLAIGNELDNLDTEINTYVSTLGTNAIQLSNINEEVEGYAINFLTSDRIQKAINKIETEGFATGRGSEYEAYWKRQYGSNFVKIGRGGKVITKDETISAENAKDQYTAALAVKNLADTVEDFADHLKNADKWLIDLYADKEGKALTASDIKALTGQEYTELVDKDPQKLLNNPAIQQKIREAGEKLGIEFADNFVNWSDEALEFANELIEGAIFASGRTSKALGKINNTTIQGRLSSSGFSELTSSQLEGLVDNLSAVFAQSGEQATTDLMDSITKVAGANIGKFVDALNLMDWSSIKSVDDFTEILKEMKIPVNTNTEEFKALWAQLRDVANAVTEVNLEALLKKIETLNEVTSKLMKGDLARTWSDKEFEALKEAGIGDNILSQFQKNLDGEYIYLGNSMDELREAIIGATKVETERAKEALRTQIKAQGILNGSQKFNEFFKKDFNDLTESEKDRALVVLLEELKAGGIKDYGQLGIEGLAGSESGLQTAAKIIQSGNLDTVLSGLIAKATEVGLKEGLENLELDAGVSQRLTESIAENASQVFSNEAAKNAFKMQLQELFDIDQYSEYYTMLDSVNEEEAQFAANKLLSISRIYEEANALGIDTEKLDEYSNALMHLNGKLDKETATAVALANTKMNAGLGEIIGSYKEWTSLIDKSTGVIKVSASEDVEAFNKLKTSVNKMLNTTTPLSDEFWNTKENMVLLKEAAEGDVEAFAQLQKIAATDFLKNSVVQELAIRFDGQRSEQEIESTINNIIDLINNTTLPKLEAGVEINEGEYRDFLEKLYTMMKAAGMTSTQINEAFDDIGFKVIQTYRTEKMFVGFRAHRGRTEDGNVGVINEPVYESVQIPDALQFVSTGSGGGGWSGNNIESGHSNRPNSSPSGGGGGSSKPSYWKNPYDELYNLQEKINEALRKRESLEREYQKLLKSQTSSIRDIRNGYYEQINALREEIRLQQQLQAGRQNQILNLGNQIYTDSEGNRRSYSSMGVTRYAHYDFNTGTITIDWAGLEAIANDPNRTAEGEAAEAYINLLQELVSSYEETRDAIWDIEDRIEDLMREAIDSYISFEDRVKDALISRYEKQIDTLEKMNDAINEAATKVIDSIQEQIAAQRQERANQKAEESIAEKEARLAYLRRDTSGSNELEILQLEKEIEEARQNYEDSLIDQAIEQMRKDADLAAEQRAQQIEIMRAQLQLAIDSGEIWQEVYDLINSATDENGQLDFNSELIRLLKEAEAFDALSAFGSDEWIRKLGEEFRRAIEGLAAGGADYAGQHQGEGGSGEGEGTEPSPGTSTGTGGAQGTGPANWPEGWPLPSETTGIIKKGSKGIPVKSIQEALNQLGYTDSNGNLLSVDGSFGDKTEQAVKNFQQAMGIGPDGKVGDQTRAKFRLLHFATGGLVDFTGPAWLDGSRSNPELILNAEDTQNFIALKNVLSRLLTGQNPLSTQFGNAYFDIDVNAEIGSDYDVDRLVSELKNEIVKSSAYRNVNAINFIR